MATKAEEIEIRPEDARGGRSPEEQESHRILIDLYEEWEQGEGVPILGGFGIDLRESEVKHWARYDVPGAIVDVAGQGDFLNMFLLEVPPGGRTAPVQHLFEVTGYVISGRGNIVVGSGSEQHSFEYGPRAGFALPLNEPYQIFNASGTESTRLALVTSMPIMIKLLHDADFIFSASHHFQDRIGDEHFYNGSGDALYATNKGIARHLWETNFISDLGTFAQMKVLNERGKNSTNIGFQMADGTMYSHMSEIPVGSYKKAHRHPAGYHIFAVTGKGYSLLWYEGDKERIRVDWEHGCCYAPPDDMFHQHFNVSGEPARYFAVGPMGGIRYHFVSNALMVRSAASVRERGDQIEPQDEDPEIREIYLKELAKTGIRFTMDD